MHAGLYKHANKNNSFKIAPRLPRAEECSELKLGNQEPHPVIAHCMALKAAQAEAAAAETPRAADAAAAASAAVAKARKSFTPMMIVLFL